ncbi:hypothetical protein R3I94_010483 [Phoxinus phoxinus]
MEDDLQQFIRSRDVPEEDIILMNRDKIDKSVLSVMTDGQMAKYIHSYGDRLAVLSFGQQTAACSDKLSLLQNLRDKIEARKLGSKSAKTLNVKACVFPKEKMYWQDTKMYLQKNPPEELKLDGFTSAVMETSK